MLKYIRETLDFYIEKSIDKKTDHNMALVLYKMFEGKFVCASIKHKIWYEFKNHKWEEDGFGDYITKSYNKKSIGAL